MIISLLASHLARQQGGLVAAKEVLRGLERVEGVKKAYLLDRNVVSIIKDSISGVLQHDGKKLGMLVWLRSIDRPGNFVSPLFSIMEGQLGRIESAEEKAETLQKECACISRFFKRAKTDSDFLLDSYELVSSVFSGKVEANFDVYVEFLREVCGKIYQPVSRERARVLKEEIISGANGRSIPLGHPVVVCCLSVLYGCQFSRKLLKPKENMCNLHNSLSDILIIPRLSHVRAVGTNKGIFFKFVTLDEGLDFFVSRTSIERSNVVGDGFVYSDVSYDRDLFPNITDDEYYSLMSELGAKYVE